MILAERDEVYCYADRFDEKYDLVRTVRKGKWKYIRNYQGFYLMDSRIITVTEC